jgi:GT2 family glycosyltransferase
MIEKLVSVIIPSFKMGQFISEALDSVGAQTYPHWEVIVVDDAGPEDGTRASVEAFAAKYPDHRVEYIRHDKNQGVGPSRNTACAAANGDLLAFLDPDDYWRAEHLAVASSRFEQEAGIGVCCSPVEVFKVETNYRTVWRFQKWHIANFPASLACHNFIQPSAVVMQRKVIELAGGFTSKPKLQHIEDHDLWIRLARMGVRFDFNEQPTCLYRLHNGSAMARKGLKHRLQLAIAEEHREFFLAMHASLFGEVFNAMENMDGALGSLRGRTENMDNAQDSLRGRMGRRIRSWLRAMRKSLGSKRWFSMIWERLRIQYF